MLNAIKEKMGECKWKCKIYLGKLKGSTLPNDFDFINLKNIEIETFSFCNRQCWFCPNSFIDRHTQNIEMSEKLYLSILEQLAEIHFAGTLSFSRYNEPLAKRELILTRIKQAREFLPNAILTTNTNGDYLTKDYIDALCDAGLNSLNIQHYLQKNEVFEAKSIKKSFAQVAEKLGLEYRISREISGRIEAEFIYPNMQITARARDFRKNGCTRGDSLTTIEKTNRSTGCLIPYIALYIDYNGQIVPCCNLRSDFAPHKRYVLGDCNNESLREIFNNKNTLTFRKNVKGWVHIDVCKNCKFHDGYVGYMEDMDYIRERQKKNKY